MTYSEMSEALMELYHDFLRQRPLKGEPVAFVSQEAGIRMERGFVDQAAREGRQFSLVWNRVGPVLVVPTLRVDGPLIILVDAGTGAAVHAGIFTKKVAMRDGRP